MGSASDWHAFLDEFRTFGGKAENVMQRKGAFGMGLFPIDPAKPVDLFIPDELLVSIENIELRGGEVVIKDDNSFPAGYGDWFRRYQANYSWGAEGRENTLAFEEGLKGLPDSIGMMMKRVGLYNSDNRFPGTDPDQELLNRFIQTRCINRKDRRVIMPMIDLLNHAPSAKPYDMSGDGIAVAGLHDGEVLVKYSVSDPIRRLLGYGFNAPETLGFSLSFRLQHRDRLVVVQGGGGRQPLQPCGIELKDDRVVLKQPLLASSTSPKMPRTLLIKACRSLEGIDAHELFEQIHQRNTQALVQMLRELQGVEGDVAQRLRNGCFDQLAALSHHIGQRDDLLAEEAATPAVA
ncbi:MAG: hypothetical protein H2063_09335 [Synechococcus sp.]|jgi:hypothetical protein|nr:hypothetical protein [Synechococcus sp.]